MDNLNGRMLSQTPHRSGAPWLREEALHPIHDMDKIANAHVELDRLAEWAFPPPCTKESEQFVRIHDDLRLLSSWLTDHRDGAQTAPSLLIDANCRRLAAQALELLTRLNGQTDASRRLDRIKASLADLNALWNDSEQVLSDRKSVKYGLQNRYIRVLEYVVAADKELSLLASPLRTLLEAASFEKPLDDIQRALSQRARIATVSEGLLNLVDLLDGRLRAIGSSLPGIRQRVINLHSESPIDPSPTPPTLQPPPISSHLASMELLRQEISAERRGSLTSFTGKRSSLQRLFITGASEIRDVLFQANQDLEAWFRAALEPLEAELQSRRNRLEHQAQQLKRIHDARNRVKKEIQSLRIGYVSTAREIRSRNEIDQNLALIAGVWSGKEGQRLLGHHQEDWQQQALRLAD